MKYSFETTEAETLAYIGLIERVVTPLTAVVAEALATRMARKAEPVEASEAPVVATAPEAPKAPEAPVSEVPPVPTSYADTPVEMSSFGVPVPQSVVQPKIELPTLSPERRAEAWAAFTAFCIEWVQGFEDSTQPQPARPKLMEQLGSGSNVVAVLVMAYEIESLQRLVEKALIEKGVLPPDNEVEWLDWIDRVSATMVQISHCGFNELAGTYDYTQRWRRKK
jgi:hypothetical protein